MFVYKVLVHVHHTALQKEYVVMARDDAGAKSHALKLWGRDMVHQTRDGCAHIIDRTDSLTCAQSKSA